MDYGRKKDHWGRTAWMGVLVFCGVYDVWAVTRNHQTLSIAVWELSEHPWGRFFLFGAWSGLTFHLFADHQFQIMERYDREHP